MTDFPKRPVFTEQVPPGDDTRRRVCTRCGWVDYENPRIVVGAVCSWRQRILLCKRAIEPRKGFWTLPAGYLERNETAEEGAKREAKEEARADIEIEALLAVYNITRISQVQLIYKAALASDNVEAADETEAVQLFAWQEIPWDRLAFPSVHWALEHFNTVAEARHFSPFTNPPGETGDRLPPPSS